MGRHAWVHQHEEGEWWGGYFLRPIPVLPDEDRGPVPLTVAHDEIGRHRFGCECDPCRAYPPHLKATLRQRERARRRKAEAQSTSSSASATIVSS